jgi:hypothetical protein
MSKYISKARLAMAKFILSEIMEHVITSVYRKNKPLAAGKTSLMSEHFEKY